MKTKEQYRLEALSRLKRNKVKKKKHLFSKVKNLYLVRMIKQTPNEN